VRSSCLEVAIVMRTTQNNTAEIDGVCNMLHNMSTADNKDSISRCANCGKEGSDVTNTCNKCKSVKYCNAACKKKHRHKHKKECEEHVRLAAEHATKLRDEELRLAAEKHDEELFKQPPPEEDCPICFIRLPSLEAGSKYMPCCGKTICSGCSYAPKYDSQGNQVDIIKQNECPFCRVVAPKSDKEMNIMIIKRIEAGDAHAMHSLGCQYAIGTDGLAQDNTKTLELWHKAGELGCSGAYCCIGAVYHNGIGVEVDEEKAVHYYELGAIAGDVDARYNLGLMEREAGNTERALKHFMIAVRAGNNDSLKEIQELYADGDATKDYYTSALQSYQMYLGDIKSEQRDKAAESSEDYRYY